MPNPVSPIDTSDKIGKSIQYFVALVYLMGPISYFTYQVITNGAPDLIILLLVLSISVVSMYTIFGVKKTDKAIDKAKDLAGEDSSDKSDED